MAVGIKLPVFSQMIAIALLAILLSGKVAADTGPIDVDPQADLLPGRQDAIITVTVACTPAALESLTVHVFQSVGRLLNIGIATHEFTCATGSDSFNIEVPAIEGLKFQPGPATVLVRFSTASTAYEKGAKVRLHN